MDKRTRVAKLARKIRNRIEHDTNMYINSEPKLSRVGTVYYKHHRADEIRSMPFGKSNHLGRRAYEHLLIMRITRRWEVTAGQYYDQQFDNLYVAQQVREGLNYHFARWVMVHGTEARGYA